MPSSSSGSYHSVEVPVHFTVEVAGTIEVLPLESLAAISPGETAVAVQVLAGVEVPVVVSVLEDVIATVRVPILAGVALFRLEVAVAVPSEIGPVVDEEDAVVVGVRIERRSQPGAVVEPGERRRSRLAWAWKTEDCFSV
jgi:hypothetical protein